jgi:hypothetical protein
MGLHLRLCRHGGEIVPKAKFSKLSTRSANTNWSLHPYIQTEAPAAVRDKLKAVAYTPDGRSGEEFRQLIDADIQAYSDVVKAANLKFD